MYKPRPSSRHALDTNALRSLCRRCDCLLSPPFSVRLCRLSSPIWVWYVWIGNGLERRKQFMLFVVFCKSRGLRTAPLEGWLERPASIKVWFLYRCCGGCWWFCLEINRFLRAPWGATPIRVLSYASFSHWFVWAALAGHGWFQWGPVKSWEIQFMAVCFHHFQFFCFYSSSC